MGVPSADLSPGAFSFSMRTRIEFGEGRIADLGRLACEIAPSAKRVAVVTDFGVVAAGHVQRAADALRAQGLEVSVHDGAAENPTTDDLESMLPAVEAAAPDLFVAVGGGSCIDTAKGLAFLLAGGGPFEQYEGYGNARGVLLPLIAVPTTAGTGSEVQSFALIGVAATHRKMPCGDPQAAPRIALLDPQLTLTMPTAVTVHTGLDTLVHAAEASVSKASSALSREWARAAFVGVVEALPVVLGEPDHVTARGCMLLAAAQAGVSIENGMLGAAHSMANPLTAHFGMTHGLAVGLALPHVMRLNVQSRGAAETYAELAAAVGADASAVAAVELVSQRVEQAFGVLGLSVSLDGHGIGEDDLPRLAADAAGQWTANFNPVPVDESMFRSLYAAAWRSQ